jgi:hypothetical protein
MVWRAVDPDVLHEAAVEAAHHLIDALAVEAKLGRLVRRRHPKRELFRQWRAVQRSIEQGTGDYMKATRRFRAAIQALFLSQ